MDIYKYEKLRNVAVLGHGGCGKTTLVEACAFVTGVTTRQGVTEAGNTISDFDKVEIKHGFSVQTSVVPIIWEDTKINFLDTPGYFDFIGEAEEALSAADAAVIVISGKKGVEVGTRKAWDYCEKHDIPRMFFVTDMDDDDASFRGVIERLTELYGNKIAPFHAPIRENGKFVGFVNVVKNAGRRFNGSDYVDGDIPEYAKEYAEKYRGQLMEAVAETSEELMEKFFEGEEFTPVEVSNALSASVSDGSLVPVLMGSGLSAQGARMLLMAITKYFPSPNKKVITGVNKNSSEMFHADYDANKPFTAKVFKTIVDPFIGRFSLIKVCSGVLKNDATIYNVNSESEEKLSRLYVLRGKEQIEVSELYAGDIGAIGKLSDTKTFDTLATKDNPIIYDKPELTKPYEFKAYKAKVKADDDKVMNAISRLMEEDLTIRTENDKDNHQMLIYGIGDQHISIFAEKCLERYKVDIDIYKPKFSYRETVRRKATSEYKFKKQSGGHGQYGHVIIDFEPSGDTSVPYVFAESVFGGAVPKNYFPAVEKGIAESVLAGPLAGYPVVGLKATLTGGSYHEVDSSENSFKTATKMCFKEGVIKAGDIILEPIAELKVIAPERFTGDVMGDLNKKRGRVMGMNMLHNKQQEIIAEVPLSELYGYSTALRSLTVGIGTYSYKLIRFDPAPSDVQERVIEESKAEAES
ncbi:MAG: elongation factor G [Lachnospiraceae bacterium]|nr:elongation factor G [Lachnospiraceae bacterium]